MKIKTPFIALSALALVSASASAASITFSGADFSADTQVSTIGSLIGALNPTSTELVNTVTFDALAANPGTIALNSGVTLDFFGGVSATGSPGSAGALTANSTFNPSNAGVGNGNLTFSNLVVGGQYEIQFIFSDTRFASDIEIYDNGTGTGAVTFTTADIQTAQIVTGTFTADATGTQELWTSQNNFHGVFSAVQLRAVPEPSSAALLGLGGIALILRRRK